MKFIAEEMILNELLDLYHESFDDFQNYYEKLKNIPAFNRENEDGYDPVFWLFIENDEFRKFICDFRDFLPKFKNFYYLCLEMTNNYEN